MEHQKILNLFNVASDSKFGIKNRTLPIISHMENMVKDLKSFIM